MAAEYPSGAKSFTPIVDGVDFPQATDVNQAYDEISAIETALLNGLAHHLLFTDATYDIGASGATRPRNLFLSGNATIGGTLALTGLATLTAGLQLVSSSGPKIRGAVNGAVANDGTFNPFSGAPVGFLFVQVSDGAQAIFVVNGTTTFEVSDPGTAFSATVDTGSSYNVYVTGGNLTVQNKSGAERDFDCTLIERG